MGEREGKVKSRLCMCTRVCVYILWEMGVGRCKVRKSSLTKYHTKLRPEI